MKKQDIIEAIQRTAKANGGKPLGISTFARETGIKVDDWQGKFWVRWGDAVREAGLIANQMTIAFGNDALILKLIELIRELGHLPLRAEIQLKAYSTEGFPQYITIVKNLGVKKERIAKIAAYCRTHAGYEDILQLCNAYEENEEVDETEPQSENGDGWVYLLKSGRFYKIGRTTDLTRRRGQLAIQLPETLEIIHQIHTDDASGIEAYWHKRFEAKRREGEWFELSGKDIQAFKRRKHFM